METTPMAPHPEFAKLWDWVRDRCRSHDWWAELDRGKAQLHWAFSGRVWVGAEAYEMPPYPWNPPLRRTSRIASSVVGTLGTFPRPGVDFSYFSDGDPLTGANRENVSSTMLTEAEDDGRDDGKRAHRFRSCPLSAPETIRAIFTLPFYAEEQLAYASEGRYLTLHILYACIRHQCYQWEEEKGSYLRRYLRERGGATTSPVVKRDIQSFKPIGYLCPAIWGCI